MSQVGSKFKVIDFCQIIIVQIYDRQGLGYLIDFDLRDLLVLAVNMSQSIEIVVYRLVSPALLTGTRFGNHLNG